MVKFIQNKSKENHVANSQIENFEILDMMEFIRDSGLGIIIKSNLISMLFELYERRVQVSSEPLNDLELLRFRAIKGAHSERN